MNTHTDRTKAVGGMVLRPVGYVRSPRGGPNEHVHGKSGWDDRPSRIELRPEHAAKLRGLGGYTHVIVMYWMHRIAEWRMPRKHHKPPGVQVFATRMPLRPNPVGLCVAEVQSHSPETGELVVRNLDACDGAPVLDIKPYLPRFDSVPDAKIPSWVQAGLDAHFGPASAGGGAD